MQLNSHSQCPVCFGSYKLEHKALDFNLFCPKHKSMFKMKDIFSENIQGFSPAPFIGRFGYPNISVGMLSTSYTKESYLNFDNPRLWAQNQFDIQRIVDLRSSLVNSRFKALITDTRKASKFLEITQEIGMASRPVDLDIYLKEKPHFKINFGDYSAPSGPNATLVKAEITSNPIISNKVEKVFSDTDLKSTEALSFLYSSGIDENHLAKILSVGALGLKKDRKLVPTRWSITAVDDTIGKQVIEQIKNFPLYDYSIFFGQHLGNYYLILAVPQTWNYELYEFAVPDIYKYMTDSESYYGRKDYAKNTAGGYYSVRLAVAEKLKELKKQAGVLALRFITDEYKVPLGVWVTREAARKTLVSQPMNFLSIDLMIDYAQKFAKNKFGMDISLILKKSMILKNSKQKSLKEF